MGSFEIAGVRIGLGCACYVVAEIGMAHDGSLGLAHAFVDAAKEAGANGVKFQTHVAEAESTQRERFRVPMSGQDPSRYAYWLRTAFKRQEWADLATHAADLGLGFLTSPFSEAALSLLEHTDIAAWKVASGEVTNTPLLRALASTKMPVILSSGMSTWVELDAAVETLRERTDALALLQCTSEYPCPPEKLGLSTIDEMRSRYDLPVGLSDHSGTIFPGLVASAVHNISLLEVHLTLSRRMSGPDVRASLTVPELRQLCEGLQVTRAALVSRVDKDGLAEEFGEMRELFGRSIVAARALASGTVLTLQDVTPKKPGGGLTPADIDRILGRRLRHALAYDEPLHWDDLV